MVDLVGDCPDCLVFWETQPGFAEGFMRVAAEVGAEPADLAWDYLAAYHARGHRTALP